MRTLLSVATEHKSTPQQLPSVFPAWEKAGIRLRKGTTTMIAATPASLKSMLTLYLVGRMDLPTLFFSADTDSFESAKRAAAMTSGDTQTQVEQNFAKGDVSRYQDWLGRLPIRWVFETDPTYKDIALETAAYAEVYGAFPQIIVIDNLMNVVGENDNEFGAMRDTTKAIKRLVRITGASVFVLHHMSEQEKDHGTPPARRRLQGKVSQLPEVILSLALVNDELRVAAVKNRFGPGDASGERYATLYTSPERCQFYNTRQAMQTGHPA